MNDKYGMESQNGPDEFSETDFARAERLSRELYFASERLKSFYRMAESGVWVPTGEYSELINKLNKAIHINKKFKVYGTDGCKSCETGRVTLFIANDECISCNPESYELVTPQEAQK